MLARLVYPVANPIFPYQFCKGYYPRISIGKLNGRVRQLLVSPLLMVIQKTCGHQEEKAVKLFAANIVEAGHRFLENPMETPFIPS